MRTSTPPHHLHSRLHGSERVLDLGRLLLGLTVVALGVLFLLDSAGALDAGQAIDDFWPLLLVAAGLLTLAERPPSAVRGWLLIGAGAAAVAVHRRCARRSHVGLHLARADHPHGGR